MSARSRRQTRRLRFDRPRTSWPTVHNERERCRKIGGPTYTIYRIGEAFELMSWQGVVLGDVYRTAAQQVEAFRAHAARKVAARNEEHFADVMASRGWDMREDNTLV